jgi:hypothetical protein
MSAANIQNTSEDILCNIASCILSQKECMYSGLFYTDMPHTNLTKYQGGIYYTDIKLFSNLLPTIKSLNYDIKAFRSALKYYLLTHSYSVDDLTSFEKY